VASRPSGLIDIGSDRHVATQTAPRTAARRFPRLTARPTTGLSKHWTWRIAGYVLFVGAWQLLSTFVFEPFILPGPGAVLREMWEILRGGDFWPNFWATTKHLAIGFVLAFLLGTAIGIAMGRSPYWDGFFRDYVMLTLTTPGLVFALICVMIFGLATAAPIVAIVLTSFPHITVNVEEGVRAIPRELLDMATAYGVDRRTQLRHIVLPSVAPYLFTAVRYGFAIAWKITALTELFGGSEGVGIQIRVKFELFNTAGVIAWAFFLVALALVTERLVLQRLERRFFRWRPRAFT
jgi:NitT/TauT family transport system permease protein